MNVVILEGNIGQDVETRTTDGGRTLTRIRMATTRKFNGQKYTDWHTVVCWGDQAEHAKSFSKGDKIHVVGSLRTRSFEQRGEKRYVTEVVAAGLALLFMKGQGRSSGGSQGGDQGPGSDPGDFEY